MENEALFTLLVNQAADHYKAWRAMVQKYVHDPREGTVTELFEKDAREWTAWKKLGVE